MPTPRSPRRRTRAATERPAVAREAKDLLLKQLAAGLQEVLAPIVEALPSELPVLEVRAEQPDRLYRLADRTIGHLEFQLTSEPSALRRFYRYHFAASEEHDTEVYTIVFHGPGIASAPDTLRRGSAVYTVRNVFIGQQEGEAVVAHLRERLARGEALSSVLRTQLKLLPLMKQQRPLPEVLLEVAHLTGALAAPERRDILGTMLGMAYNYLKPEIIDQLLKEPEVATALEQMIIDKLTEGRNRFRLEGRMEGQQKDLLNILTARFGGVPDTIRERISQVTDVSRLTILITAAAVAKGLEDFTQTLESSTGA